MNQIILIHGFGNESHSGFMNYLIQMLSLGRSIFIRDEAWLVNKLRKYTPEQIPLLDLFDGASSIVLWGCRDTEMVNKLNKISTYVQNPEHSLDDVVCRDNLLVLIDNESFYERLVWTYPHLLSRIILNDVDRDLSLLKMIIGG